MNSPDAARQRSPTATAAAPVTAIPADVDHSAIAADGRHAPSRAQTNDTSSTAIASPPAVPQFTSRVVRPSCVALLAADAPTGLPAAAASAVAIPAPAVVERNWAFIPLGSSTSTDGCEDDDESFFPLVKAVTDTSTRVELDRASVGVAAGVEAEGGKFSDRFNSVVQKGGNADEIGGVAAGDEGENGEAAPTPGGSDLVREKMLLAAGNDGEKDAASERECVSEEPARRVERSIPSVHSSSRTRSSLAGSSIDGQCNTGCPPPSRVVIEIFPSNVVTTMSSVPDPVGGATNPGNGKEADPAASTSAG